MYICIYHKKTYISRRSSLSYSSALASQTYQPFLHIFFEYRGWQTDFCSCHQTKLRNLGRCVCVFCDTFLIHFLSTNRLVCRSISRSVLLATCLDVCRYAACLRVCARVRNVRLNALHVMRASNLHHFKRSPSTGLPSFPLSSISKRKMINVIG